MSVVSLSPENVAQAFEQPSFSRSRNFQRGHGIFASLGSAIIPVLASLGKYLLSRGNEFIDNTTQSIRSGATFGRALKQGAANTYNTVKNDFRKLKGGGAAAKRGVKKQYKSKGSRKRTRIFP
jgi:hypothetical protein